MPTLLEEENANVAIPLHTLFEMLLNIIYKQFTSCFTHKELRWFHGLQIYTWLVLFRIDPSSSTLFFIVGVIFLFFAYLGYNSSYYNQLLTFTYPKKG